MPRGAIAKRSARPGAGGPSVSTPLLAFPNVATMAAFDATAFVNGGIAEVQTLSDTFILDKTSALAVTPTTIINAIGGGQWLRESIPSLRWRLQQQWYIGFTTGNDEAGGGLLAPIKTFAELKRRWGEGPLLNSNVIFYEDSPENVLYDFNSPGAVEIQGSSSTSFSGVISGAVQASGAGSVTAQITAAALPVSWTASGLVGKVAVLTSGASLGAVFVISRDLAAKTARITQPTQTNPPATLPFANGDTFDVQVLRRLTGVWRICAEPGQLSIGFVEMFTCRVSSGDPLWGASIMNGVTADGSGRARFAGCRVDNALAQEGGDGEIYAFASSLTGTILGAGVSISRGASATLEESICEGGGAGTVGVLGDELSTLSVLTYAAFYGADGGVRLGSKASLDASQAYLFGTGVTVTGIELGSDSTLIYSNGFLPNILAPAAQTRIGGAVKTYATLPFLNMGNGAEAVSDVGTLAMVDTFVALAADINTAAGALAFTTVLTSNITVDGTRDVVYDVTWGITCLPNTNGAVALFIDGTRVVGGPAFAGAIALIVGGSCRWKSTGAGLLAPGAHVITVRWTQAGAAAQMFCRPLTELGEHMTLTVREVVRDT